MARIWWCTGMEQGVTDFDRVDRFVTQRFNGQNAATHIAALRIQRNIFSPNPKNESRLRLLEAYLLRQFLRQREREICTVDRLVFQCDVNEGHRWVANETGNEQPLKAFINFYRGTHMLQDTV